jgi:hypothetical protein
VGHGHPRGALVGIDVVSFLISSVLEDLDLESLLNDLKKFLLLYLFFLVFLALSRLLGHFNNSTELFGLNNRSLTLAKGALSFFHDEWLGDLLLLRETELAGSFSGLEGEDLLKEAFSSHWFQVGVGF